MSPVGPGPVPGNPAPGMHLPGWVHPDELTWLRATAATMGSVTEIGSMYGRSAFALLGGCPGPVYCVDPWDDPGRYRSFLDNCGHFPNLRAIRGRSPHAADQVPDVDMVFIDGNHEHTAVLADIQAWLPKTRKLICGHDYNHAGYPGIRVVVDAIFGDRVRPATGDDWTRSISIWAVDLEGAPPDRSSRRLS